MSFDNIHNLNNEHKEEKECLNDTLVIEEEPEACASSTPKRQESETEQPLNWEKGSEAMAAAPRIVSIQKVDIPPEVLNKAGPSGVKRRVTDEPREENVNKLSNEETEFLREVYDEDNPMPPKRNRGCPLTSGEYKQLAKARQELLEVRRQEVNLNAEEVFIQHCKEMRSARAFRREAVRLAGEDTERGKGMEVSSALQDLTEGVTTIREVASRSKNLKGTYIKGLKMVASIIEAAYNTLTSLSDSAEVARLERENERLAAETRSLRARMEETERRLRSITAPPSFPSDAPCPLAASLCEEDKAKHKPSSTAPRVNKRKVEAKGTYNLDHESCFPGAIPLPDNEWEDTADMAMEVERDNFPSSQPGRVEASVCSPNLLEVGETEKNIMSVLESKFSQLCGQLKDEVTGTILRQTGNIVSARMAAIDHRLLPAKIIRPPLKGDLKKEGDNRKVNTAPKPPLKLRRGGNQAEGGMDIPKEQPKEQRLQSKKGDGAPSRRTTGGTDVLQPPSRTRTGEKRATSYADALGRKEKKRSSPGLPLRAAIRDQGSGPSGKPEQPLPKGKEEPKGNKKGKKKKKRKAPGTSAAVVISQPLNVREGEEFSLAEVVAEATGKIDLESIGLEYVRPKRAITGGLILEIPGGKGKEKADSLAEKLKEALGERARISRPSRTAELRITGLDESASPQTIAAAIARVGNCGLDEVRVGDTYKAPNGLFAAWTRCPAEVAHAVATAGTLKIGWVKARVIALGKRPLQCHRCLEIGHTIQHCGGPDRRAICYRCGEPGHLAAKCTTAAFCVLCSDKNKPARHRMGGAACQSVRPMGKNRRPGPLNRKGKEEEREARQEKDKDKKREKEKTKDKERASPQGTVSHPQANQVMEKEGPTLRSRSRKRAEEGTSTVEKKMNQTVKAGKKGVSKGKKASAPRSLQQAQRASRRTSRTRVEGQEEAMETSV